MFHDVEIHTFCCRSIICYFSDIVAYFIRNSNGKARTQYIACCATSVPVINYNNNMCNQSGKYMTQSCGRLITRGHICKPDPSRDLDS